ncbi:MAG: cytochrome c biogenesis CcdA family protein [Actinomycetota bacterium]
MLEVPWAFALAAGMAAALNPCGFAMLPAYLTYFVGTGEEGADQGRSITRALMVSLVLTAGFVLVFGVFGLITTPFAISIEEHLPWVTIVIGIALAILGVAMLAGKQVMLSVPKMGAGGGRELPSMFLFGISYAVASLSCTIGPFLAVTTSTFRSANYASGVLAFVTYGLGMGLLISILTLAVALAQTSVVTTIRKALPYVTRVSGVLLVLAGLYVAWYGWWEVRTLRGDFSDDPIAGVGEDVQQWVTQQINDIGATTLAWWFGGALVVAFGASVALRRRRKDRQDDEELAPSAPVSVGSTSEA